MGEAKTFWQKALKINPHFDWALKNLADLNQPEEERSGAWAYPFENWLLAAVGQNMASILGKVKRTHKKAAVQKLLANMIEEKHPELFFLAPHLLARGDANARDFVVQTAAVSANPVLVTLAKEYIFGERGSFNERMQAAKLLSEAELLPSGPVQIWSGRQLREIMLLNIEISPEPEPSDLPPKAQSLAEEAFAALYDRDGERAQALLEQALTIAPNKPSLINNLAKALELQGRSEEALQMALDLHQQFPDYFFGIIGAASHEILTGNLERAHEMLNGLMQHKKMHTSEFVALCQAQIQVWLVEKNPEAARSWLELWEKVDPENPALLYNRIKIGPARKK